VRIFQQTRPKVLAIPKRAIKREAGKKYVDVINGTQPVKRWVDVGWTDGKYTEITRGLKEGERVIIDKKEDITKW
jgi:multidrug efflux pump subunit AcrA (membrane-fusion protein)